MGGARNEGGTVATGAIRRLVAAIVARGGHATSLSRRGDGSISATALVASRGALRAGEAVTLLAPIAETLAIAHELGVAHGAVSLDAIVVDPSGRPVLGGWQHATRLEPGPRSGPGRPRGRARRRGGAEPRATDAQALATALRVVTGAAQERDRSGPLAVDVERVAAAAMPDRDAGPARDGAPAVPSPAARLAEALYDWTSPEPLDLAATDDAASVLGVSQRRPPDPAISAPGPRAPRGVLGALRRRPLLAAVAACCAAAIVGVALIDGAPGASGDGADAGAAGARGDSLVEDDSLVEGDSLVDGPAGGDGHVGVDAPAGTPPEEASLEDTASIDDPLAAGIALVDARNACAAARDESCLVVLYAPDAPGLGADLAVIAHPAPPEPVPTHDCALADRNGTVALIVCGGPGEESSPPGDAGPPPPVGVSATITWGGAAWLLRELRPA